MTADRINKTSTFDIAIIGGGASGMACALMLSGFFEKSLKTHPSIVLIEKNPRLGKKLLLTGNGRCNLTNREITADRYHGNRAAFVSHTISEFGSEDTREFFRKIGLSTFYDESGKAFPESLLASSVLDCMRFSLEESNTELLLSTDIESISKVKSRFILVDSQGRTHAARYVVVTCGGAASPFTGSDGSGYELLRSLGHTVIPPLPGIVQIKTETDFVKSVSGVKVIGTASLRVDGDVVRSESGEILFTDFGISGPPILQLSGLASRSISGFSGVKPSRKVEVIIDFMSGKTETEVGQMLRERRDAFPRRKIDQMLVGIFHNRLSTRLIKNATDKPLSMEISSLSDMDLDRLAAQIKRSKFIVTGVMPLTNAQVTIGGASTDEFDPETMRSILCDNLYACGEVLDIDGDCGGYNLQWAWSSAFIAARSIAQFLENGTSDDASSAKKNGGGAQ